MATVIADAPVSSGLAPQLSRLITLGAWGYPILMLSVAVGSWLCGWALLGHMPRPSLDDPKRVLGWGAYLMPLVIMAMPIGAICALCQMANWAVPGRLRPLMAMMACLLLSLVWAGVFLFLQSDFQGMTTWLAD